MSVLWLEGSRRARLMRALVHGERHWRGLAAETHLPLADVAAIVCDLISTGYVEPLPNANGPVFRARTGVWSARRRVPSTPSGAH